jgi:hypothetical protein
MNKIDREILNILKDVFQLKRIRPIESDHNMRLWLIRSTFLVSVFGLVSRIVAEFIGHEITAEYSAIVNTPIAFFFTGLFLHINNEVEDTSVIIFILTWVALMLGLYA